MLIGILAAFVLFYCACVAGSAMRFGLGDGDEVYADAPAISQPGVVATERAAVHTF